MMKIIMVVVILMEETAVVKMLTQTFAPYVNALKKKHHCQTVNMYIVITGLWYFEYFLCCSPGRVIRVLFFTLVVGCCFEDSNNPGECLCTGTDIDDPDNAGSCCLDDEANPGNCCKFLRDKFPQFLISNFLLFS